MEVLEEVVDDIYTCGVCFGKINFKVGECVSILKERSIILALK